MTTQTAVRLHTELGTNPNTHTDDIKTYDYGSFILRMSQQPSRQPYRLGTKAVILSGIGVGGLSAYYGHPSNMPIETPDTLANPKSAYGIYLRSAGDQDSALNIQDGNHREPVEVVGSALFVPRDLAVDTIHALGDLEGSRPTGTMLERLTRSLNGRVHLPRICGAVILYGPIGDGPDVAEAMVFNDEASVLPVRS